MNGSATDSEVEIPNAVLAAPFRRILGTIVVSLAVAALVNTLLGFYLISAINGVGLVAALAAWRVAARGNIKRAAAITFYSFSLMFTVVLLFSKGGSIAIAAFPAVLFLGCVFLDRPAYWGLAVFILVCVTAVIVADMPSLTLGRAWTMMELRSLIGIWIIVVASAVGGRWLMHAIRGLSGALRRSEDRMQKIFRLSQNAVSVSRLADGTILDCNDAYLAIFGYERDTVIGRTSLALNTWESPSERERFVSHLREYRGVKGFQTRARKRTGETIEALLSAEVLDIDGEQCLVVSTADVTAQREAERKAEFLTTRDALTGLPNRLLALDRLQRALEQARRRNEAMVVMHIGLDRFKEFNASFGRNAGDGLLREACSRIQATLSVDDTLARVGADEFLCSATLPESNPQAEHRAKSMLAIFERPFDLTGNTTRVSCSIGVSISTSGAKDAEALMHEASTAMHVAKAEGKGNYRLFDSSMSEHARDWLFLETSLRDTIERKGLRLAFQPKFDTHTRRVVGLEALARWTHSELGEIPPARFIPIAEESGLILTLGSWALRESCVQIARWQKAGIGAVPIAVNLSVRQLVPALPQLIAKCIDDCGIDPGMVELEVTESMLIGDPLTTRKILEEIAAAGSRITLDDFGVGYSSLNYLKHLHLHCIKIDRSFIADIAMSRSDAAIVSAIIGLAHGLGIRVVAEGIETEEQLDALRALDCDEVQGYLLSRPLAADEVAERFLAAS